MGEDEHLTVGTGGRELDVLVEGPEDGTVLLYHGGTPCAATRMPPLFRAAEARGLRVVTWSRPGYATSSPQSGRSVADAVPDAEAILNELGVQRCVTLGWSGGGPHALACAALMKGRCMAATAMAGVAPHGVEGLDWTGGMGRGNVEEFGAALAGPATLEPRLRRLAAGMDHLTGPKMVDALGSLVSDPDRAALTGEVADALADSFKAGVSTGIEGWLEDDLAFTRDWGFDVASIRTPVSIWQGVEDRMVPTSHGRWLAANLRGARSHFLEGEGHISLWRHVDQILDELLELAGLHQPAAS
jgi:pimeloyl-ACP methyl ester carboxylesterase